MRVGESPEPNGGAGRSADHAEAAARGPDDEAARRGPGDDEAAGRGQKDAEAAGREPSDADAAARMRARQERERAAEEARARVTRRRFLQLAGAGAAAGLGYTGVVEPRRVEFTRHDLGQSFQLTGWPLRAAVLADLHLGGVGRVHERIAEELEQAAPDVVFFPGDTVEEPSGLSELDAFLGLLPETLLVAVMGNWEYWGGVDAARLAAVFERHRGTLLVNESVTVEVAPTPLLVTGVDDLLAGTPDLRSALTGWRPHAGHVVLAHCPAYRDRIGGELDQVRQEGLARGLPAPFVDFEPTLVLSGHTHGGQVRLPGLDFRPRGSGPYLSGWYDDDAGPRLFVSRGIGTSVIPLRLRARPEVALLDLRV